MGNKSDVDLSCPWLLFWYQHSMWFYTSTLYIRKLSLQKHLGLITFFTAFFMGRKDIKMIFPLHDSFQVSKSGVFFLPSFLCSFLCVPDLEVCDFTKLLLTIFVYMCTFLQNILALLKQWNVWEKVEPSSDWKLLTSESKPTCFIKGSHLHEL